MQGKTNEQKIVVETPIGEIVAKTTGTPDEYPGIHIAVNNVSYVLVEYDQI